MAGKRLAIGRKEEEGSDPLAVGDSFFFAAPCTSSCFRFFSSFVLFMWIHEKKTHERGDGSGSGAIQFTAFALSLSLARKT